MYRKERGFLVSMSTNSAQETAKAKFQRRDGLWQIRNKYFRGVFERKEERKGGSGMENYISAIRDPCRIFQLRQQK